MSVLAKARIEHDRFLRFVNLFDRAVGTIEPLNRRVYFYSRFNTLRVYATDGCLTIDMHLGDVTKHFESFYVAPLDNIKLISRNANLDNVEILFGEKLEFFKGSEYLSVLHPLSRNPKKSGAFVPKVEVKSSELAHVVDVGSIISRSGQDILVGVINERFFALCEEYGHISIASMRLIMDPFMAEVPYETARHLMKALDIIRSEKLMIGISESTVGLKFSDGVIGVCAAETNEEADKVEKFLKIGKGDIILSTKMLKTGTSLCARFQRQNRGKGYFELSDQLRMGVISQSSAYEYIQPVECRTHVRVSIIPKKLNQFLTRIHEKSVHLNITKEFVIFKGKNAIFAIKR